MPESRDNGPILFEKRISQLHADSRFRDGSQHDVDHSSPSPSLRGVFVDEGCMVYGHVVCLHAVYNYEVCVCVESVTCI